MNDTSLCDAALARYGVRARRLRPLAAAVARVDADDGRRYALRCRPRADRVFGNIPLELAWTAALRADTGIRPPEPLPGADGALIQEVAAPETGEPHDCVLFEWVPGPELSRRLSSDNVRKLGLLSARLHGHAATFRPPPELTVRRLGRLVRDGERDVLLAHEHPRFLPPPRRAVFEAIAACFHATLATLYADPSGLRVVHADLHHENVKVDRGRLRPLDFYEVVWAYPVQDVSLTLYDLRYYADCQPHGYPAIRDAFAEGYASRLPWPEQRPGQVDTLVAGRLLRRANYVLWRQTAAFADDPAAVPDPLRLEPFFAWLEFDLRSLLDRIP
jgi:Ser/Thr protein kinase RdoA (MazF antagonist)